tara:strand:+ start:433 stop:549 length:117 start_codon:yes stop_codon:yes gene_type:complete
VKEEKKKITKRREKKKTIEEIMTSQFYCIFHGCNGLGR